MFQIPDSPFFVCHFSLSFVGAMYLIPVKNVYDDDLMCRLSNRKVSFICIQSAAAAAAAVLSVAILLLLQQQRCCFLLLFVIVCRMTFFWLVR